jgi:hypothetical protein
MHAQDVATQSSLASKHVGGVQGLEVRFGAEARYWTDKDQAAPILTFLSIIPVGSGSALVAAHLMDPRSLVRRIHFGRNGPNEIVAIGSELVQGDERAEQGAQIGRPRPRMQPRRRSERAAAAIASSSSSVMSALIRGPESSDSRGKFFLGLLPAQGGSVSFEVALENGKTVAGWGSPIGDLQPFVHHVETINEEAAIVWIAELHQAVRRIGAPKTAPSLETLTEALLRRMDTSTNLLSAAGRGNAFVDAAERILDVGIVLRGWILHDPNDPIESCSAVSLCGLRAEIELPLPATRRADAYASVGATIPGSRPDCGFVAYVAAPRLVEAAPHWFFEVRLRSGVTLRARFRLPPARPERLAIEAVIDCAEDSSVDLGDLFERALSAPINLLWKQALVVREAPKSTVYGHAPRSPLISIVVPLYGRLDLMKHQLAHFSNDPDFLCAEAIVELIYVLDDPRRERDFPLKARLAADVYGVPFRLVDLIDNFGYSTANNIGASFSTGELLILLNSDVMPKHPGWARSLLMTLKSTPNCGVLGCRLLFEDGSIQHAGMRFCSATMLPGAYTNEHPAKGLSVRHRRVPGDSRRALSRRRRVQLRLCDRRLRRLRSVPEGAQPRL